MKWRKGLSHTLADIRKSLGDGKVANFLFPDIMSCLALRAAIVVAFGIIII